MNDRLSFRLRRIKLSKAIPNQRLVAGCIVGLVIVAGVFYLVAIHAATSTANFEAEDGTRTGSATLVTDAKASGGKGVLFSSSTNTAPTVSITTPSNNATVSGATTISAAASDDVAVTKVEFYVNGTMTGAADTTSPYSVSWNAGTTAASYTLTAKAYDANSHVTTSAAVSVSVGGGGTRICGWKTTPPATYDHIIWIVMENHKYTTVIGSGLGAPYMTDLATKTCASDTNWSDAGSQFNSLPNYMTFTSGGTQGVNSDGKPADFPPVTSDNIFRQVRATGGTVKAYAEDMDSNCRQTDVNNYAVRHNPEAFYVGGTDKQACQSDNVPMGTTTSGNLISDINSNHLPTFAYILPNVCNQTHSPCTDPAIGDAWLSKWVPLLLQSATYQAGNTAIFIIYDENSPIPNAIIAPTVVPGTVLNTAFSHMSFLRTNEQMFGITNFLGGASSAPSMRTAFNL